MVMATLSRFLMRVSNVLVYSFRLYNVSMSSGDTSG
jgi:hypothetical protein